MRLIRYTTPALHAFPPAFARGLGNSLDRLFEEVTSGAATCDNSALAPRYKISETPDAFALTVELPGVAKDGLELTVDHDQIHVTARRYDLKPAAASDEPTATPEATYELVLNHDHTIEPAKIAAELRDGLLRVTLPKSEALKPRKIAVT
ncbi:MAG: Hsp20/alpha crystallin family protein [Verrucomicrobia bacterium]|nr:Hsp20/alpha crystallin family protein [Verrucomicrobiota bacterium]